MNEAEPQVDRPPLVARAIDGLVGVIVRAEQWRRTDCPSPGLDALEERLDERDKALRLDWAELDHVQTLDMASIGAGVSENRAYQTARETYESRKAREFGQRADTLSAAGGFMAAARTRLAEQAARRHTHRAQRASHALLKLV